MVEAILKFEENKHKDEILELLCVTCLGETRQRIVASYDFKGSDPEAAIDVTSSHQIVQCQGCMTSSFRQLDWCSEDVVQIGPDEYDYHERVTLYPERSKHSLPTKVFLEAPANLRRIYSETVECFNRESFTLAAAGLRAMVEGLCAEFGIVEGSKMIVATDGSIKEKRLSNLEGKISGLYQKGILTQRTAETLHAHRYLGNEALHELARPTRNELAIAIELLEHSFEAVFEVPEKGKQLRIEMAHRQGKALQTCEL